MKGVNEYEHASDMRSCISYLLYSWNFTNKHSYAM